MTINYCYVKPFKMSRESLNPFECPGAPLDGTTAASPHSSLVRSLRCALRAAIFILFVIFAQWRYRNQWGSSEVRLLLVENFYQYPALRTWNIVHSGNFWRPLRRFVRFAVNDAFDGYQMFSILIEFSMPTSRDKKLRYGSSIEKTAPILHPYRYGTVLFTVRSHTTCHTP